MSQLVLKLKDVFGLTTGHEIFWLSFFGSSQNKNETIDVGQPVLTGLQNMV